MTTVERVARSDAWRRMFVQANGRRCHYCNRRASLDLGPDDRPWHIDHKTPLARGGEDVEDNLVLACKRCNLAKGVQPYERFREFGRAAFWVPDDWRASEADLDSLMDWYQLAPGGGEDVGRWRVDRLNYRIWRIDENDEEPEGLTVLTAKPKYDMKHETAQANAAVYLISEMHRLLPAMVAEIRMLRAELAAKEGELDAAAHLT